MAAYSILHYLVVLIVQIITILIIVYVFVGYFVSPFHPFRQRLESIVSPLLAPIRRFIPPVGMLDFSPFILIIIVQILGTIIDKILATIFIH